MHFRLWQEVKNQGQPGVSAVAAVRWRWRDLLASHLQLLDVLGCLGDVCGHAAWSADHCAGRGPKCNASGVCRTCCLASGRPSGRGSNMTIMANLLLLVVFVNPRWPVCPMALLWLVFAGSQAGTVTEARDGSEQRIFAIPVYGWCMSATAWLVLGAALSGTRELGLLLYGVGAACAHRGCGCVHDGDDGMGAHARPGSRSSMSPGSGRGPSW